MHMKYLRRVSKLSGITARSWLIFALTSIVEATDNKQPGFGVSFKLFRELFGANNAKMTRCRLIQENLIYCVDGVMYPTETFICMVG